MESNNSLKLVKWCHLSSFAGFIPGGNVLGPLIIWLLYKNKHSNIDDQGKESLNFQITMTLSMALLGYFSLHFWIFKYILWLSILFNAISVISATFKSHKSRKYRYPFNLRLIN